MEFKIRIVFPKDVADVAKIASSIPSIITVTAKSGAYTVDAKSIMGIFSLDLSKAVTIILSTEQNYAVDFKYYKSLFAKYIVGESV